MMTMVMRDGERAAAQYGLMAAEYAADNAENATNAYYERPATIALVGDVAGQHVVDVGCGAGVLTGWLLDHQARVTAIDVSPEMLKLAQERVGDRARLVVADLEHGLGFLPDGGVDAVVASLVLHYVRDWEAVLGEFRRVLEADGTVVFSTHHPAMDWQAHSPEDYLAIKQVTETWHKGGRPFEVTFWRRPLTAMTEAIYRAGFVIERLVEPAPLPELEQKDPEEYRWLLTNPCFLFFKLRPVPTRP
jgi:ubiquinone/menaquinone biosynthesis C-methylase UbiE